MTETSVEFSSSSNGDRWFLTTDESGAVFVLHQANTPSGGARTRIELADFLKGHAPEHEALVRHLGTAISGPSAGDGKVRSKDIMAFRQASETEVQQALTGAKVALPLTTAYEALEFFNCMLDVLTDQRAADDTAAGDRMAAGFGSTH